MTAVLTSYHPLTEGPEYRGEPATILRAMIAKETTKLADASFLDSLKDKLPKGSTIISALFLAATMLVQWGGKSQHFADVQAQQEKRLTDVESTVHNELVTKEAVQQMQKSTDQRFDDLKEQLKNYHDEEVRFHHGRL